MKSLADKKAMKVLPQYEHFTLAELKNRIVIIKERGSKNDQREIPFILKAIANFGGRS